MTEHHAWMPVLTAVVTGALGPWLLTRAAWPHRVPRLAIAVWFTLASTFFLSVWLLLTQLLTTFGAVPGLLSLMLSCTPWGTESLGLVPAFLAPGLALVHELLRARRARRRHSATLRLVGRPDPGLKVTLLDHASPAVYCLPGRQPQVVVSTGALRALSPVQLEAALAHERAHLSGSHHLLISLASACASTFPGLPLSGLLRREIPLLVEMVADDRALHRCSPEALATALYRTASGGAPPGALPLGEASSAVVRLNRLLSPQPGAVPTVRGILSALAAAASGAALLTLCCGPLL